MRQHTVLLHVRTKKKVRYWAEIVVQVQKMHVMCNTVWYDVNKMDIVPNIIEL